MTVKVPEVQRIPVDPGMMLLGVVTKVVDEGTILDLGGLVGIIPEKPEIPVGTKIQVVVHKIDYVTGSAVVELAKPDYITILGFNVQKKEALENAVAQAIDNVVRHTKRGLLDIVDFQKNILPSNLANDPRIKAMLEAFMRRIHNDVSMVKPQIESVFQIFVNGGKIPAFGRTPEEIRASESKYAERKIHSERSPETR